MIDPKICPRYRKRECSIVDPQDDQNNQENCDDQDDHSPDISSNAKTAPFHLDQRGRNVDYGCYEQPTGIEPESQGQKPALPVLDFEEPTTNQ